MTMQRRQRRAARVILVDDRGRVLLLRGGDPSRPTAGTWWFTPGGGLEVGESVEDAARRELFEETGLVTDDLGPIVHSDQVEFRFDDAVYEQSQVFFLVRTPAFEIDTAGWNSLEVASIVEHRWWNRADLRATHDQVFPVGLAAVIDSVDRAG